MSKRPAQRARPGVQKARRGQKPRFHLYLRLGAFLAILVAVVVVAFALIRPPQSVESAGSIPVRIDMAGFEPTALQAKVGEPVKLRLINPDSQYHTDGGGKHQLAIPELGVDAIVQPKSERVISFTPTQPGTYTFYCDVCCGGKENPSMQGKLRVTA